MARRQPPHRRRPFAPCLVDCWIGGSRIVRPAYRKFVRRSPRQVVWRRRFTRFTYWRWHLGSWVPCRLFRRRLRWIAGCRRLYLRRFDRRCGHFRYCCNRCRRVRMSHVAQRTAVCQRNCADFLDRRLARIMHRSLVRPFVPLVFNSRERMRVAVG
jgi:hypothetical protein